MADSSNVFKWIVSMAIVMVAMINSKNVGVTGQQVLSGKIDLIIMLAPLFEESQRNVYNRSVLKMIHDHVYISHQNVRIGFIDLGVHDTDKNVWLPLSGEFATIGPSLMQWSPGIKNGLHAGDAMQSCKSRACEFKKNDRAKVIIAHLHYYDDSDEPVGMDAAVNVRQLGAYLYFVTNADNPNRFADWTGSPTRIFPMSKHERSVHTTLKMPEIVKAIEADLCGFCRFNAPGQKECGWKRYEASDRSYFGSDHAACAQLESSCESAAECEWACNRQWSWEKKNTELEYDCSQLECGQMRRNPILPPTTKVENCIAEIDCGKPDCPTTATTTISTTSTTTTTASTTEPTTTTSTIATTTSPTESHTTTSTASTIAPPTSATTSTSTERNSTPAGRIVVDNSNKSASSESKMLPVWVIAVIVVVVVVLLLAIVIGIVVVKKRKRRARGKRAQMDRAKRLEKFVQREKIEMEKKYFDAAVRSKSASTAKAVSISPTANVLETSIISKWKGADASTHADMSMAIGAARKSKKSSAAKIKSMGGSSSKFTDGKHESKGGVEKSLKKIGIEGSKMTAKSSQMSEGKLESKLISRVGDKKSEPSKMGSSSKVSKKK